ncbi:bifunctional diaminohydroxyphosphoribosylaminopyrimidine deaminase/5-amino-6-(5-phosphoribosylamino)uracil reductase RibD [Saccharopolyspora sp. 6V]|uniref:bifunctional diaminohydroxyphosphoribosylaminopyrimidine deaminase/5-amino-6-(5-phosphoribosylamino)uracil reductase RibD n=1 Tax=Saccharopolyspora sp. 6V TaxID=2877239 RepID=UPI001CD3E59E|nr:bifunctional diaminohydroxyphosphoribosylaminopyrimidine deaminase/5-amino-6-(5-phosphoribosylamino)uracil reductase RibD [Saccharopolyspora sp. 6V]MCA1191660.1 bifunctional diaminohydroxyphosphoribosylaminopyrimidine deaminase/5-amino-6-(5-phosphoribosylamino)uracil reductase RibD [Saccharopolyspora sp. 6V]
MSISLDELAGRDGWAAAHAEGRPFVVYKYAATLDGRSAAEDGTSQWITSATARGEGHVLRAACGAVLVGSGTQQADDPSLTVRTDDERVPEDRRHPWRIVLDTHARTKADAKIADGQSPTLLLTSPDADTSHLDGSPVEIERIPAGDDGLDLKAALEAIYRRGHEALMVEGGPTVAASLISAGLVDQVVAYIAPAILGRGRASLNGGSITTMADILRLETVNVEPIGPDVRIVARVGS